MYEVIGEPFASGGVKLTVACVSPFTAVTAVGAPGTADVGVTELEDPDGRPVPIAFVAVTVNV